MRLALRGLAILCGLSAIWTILFLSRFGWSGLDALVRTGAFGIVTCIGWAITLIAGPFAAVQLLRLRNSGRIAAAVFYGAMAAYYLAGALLFRESGVPWVPLLMTGALAAACLVLLLIPQAKRATR